MVIRRESSSFKSSEMQNNLEHLDRCITDLVRKFLFEEKNDSKAQLRDHLEERIECFLSLAADEDKFFFPETPFILLQSTSTVKKFTAHGASIAWNAIFQYATNLMAQPWRKEFYTIRMFSGYYQHNVEHNLAEAWRLLAKIGYERIDDKLFLSPPLDPDALVAVARDALVAFVECQMIQSIWEGLHKRGVAYNWIQLLEYRKLNICSVHHAISALNAEYRRRLHQTMHCHDHYDPRHVAMNQQPIYGQRYMDCYGVARYGTYVSAPMVHAPISCCNMTPNMYPVGPQPVNVPTAQLIEVEPQPTTLVPAMVPAHPQTSVLGPTYSQHSSVRPAGSPMTSTARPLHSPSSATPRMENGFVNSKSNLYATVDKSRNWDNGTSHRSQQQAVQPPTEPQSDSSGVENWDYVYSGLENQRYSKDVGERGDLLRTSGGAGDRNLSDALQRINIDDRESSEVDGSHRVSVYDNVPSPAKVRSPVQDEPSGGTYWECGHCTYHNKLERNVCEMCGRSRNPGPEEQPLASGGSQCPKCTLVNKKAATKCDACDAELKGSPTYV